MGVPCYWSFEFIDPESKTVDKDKLANQKSSFLFLISS